MFKEVDFNGVIRTIWVDENSINTNGKAFRERKEYGYVLFLTLFIFLVSQCVFQFLLFCNFFNS